MLLFTFFGNFWIIGMYRCNACYTDQVKLGMATHTVGGFLHYICFVRRFL